MTLASSRASHFLKSIQKSSLFQFLTHSGGHHLAVLCSSFSQFLVVLLVAVADRVRVRFTMVGEAGRYVPFDTRAARQLGHLGPTWAWKDRE